MGDKPVPAVPDRVLALKTPPFPAAYADPLTANKKLQDALDAAIKAGPGAGWRTPVAIVALNPDNTRPFAAYEGKEVHFSASLLKVAAMYAAFELRKTVRNVAAELGAKTTKKALLTDAAAYLNPAIIAKAATIPPLKGVKKVHCVPKYAYVFDVVAAAAAATFTVDFTKTFVTDLEQMISVSNNTNASHCIHGDGYGYLNGSLTSGGFFDAAKNVGVWLAGDYTGVYPYYRIDSVNDQLVAQATTVVDLARMYTLIHDGTLVDAGSCTEMLDLLAMAVAVPEVFIDRASALNFTVTHTKVGLGPLKAVNGGYDVYSEGSILKHTGGRKFVAVWQNYVFGAGGFDPIGHVVRETITEFLK